MKYPDPFQTIYENLERLYGNADYNGDHVDYSDASRAVKEIENVMTQIARQKLMSEMIQREAENADFEGAYETIIEMVRKVLNLQEPKS